ncbi:hypothetical protein NDU88_006872 [Pleurodeles waltl]|uniref:Uncharacterized protein n=1 Tax=Pleurodeles waltl TaxID=8319 RepID=A0AAV7RMR0_PLEWA|nr:hypothetical protein NDU88_006872 [Pleurodeles waltl]
MLRESSAELWLAPCVLSIRSLPARFETEAQCCLSPLGQNIASTVPVQGDWLALHSPQQLDRQALASPQPYTQETRSLTCLPLRRSRNQEVPDVAPLLQAPSLIPVARRTEEALRPVSTAAGGALRPPSLDPRLAQTAVRPLLWRGSEEQSGCSVSSATLVGARERTRGRCTESGVRGSGNTAASSSFSRQTVVLPGTVPR